MRTTELLDKLGLGTNLASESKATIGKRYGLRSATDFPFATRRKRAVFRAESDIFKILERYVEQSFRHTELSPFVAKIKELSSTKLPSIEKPGTSYLLKNDKPNLAHNLMDWQDFIAGNSPVRFDNTRAGRVVTNVLRETR